MNYQNIRNYGDQGEEQNFNLPNDCSIIQTEQLLKIILTHSIIPEKIVPTIEEGICLSFKNEETGFRL